MDESPRMESVIGQLEKLMFPSIFHSLAGMSMNLIYLGTGNNFIQLTCDFLAFFPSYVQVVIKQF